MKRLLSAFSVVFALTVSSGAFAASDLDMARLAKELPADVFKNASEIPAKPHFLLGLEPKTDEWEAYLEMRKVFKTKDLFYGKNDSGIIDKSSPDYRAAGNTEISEVVTVEGKKINIFYTHHHLTSDGMFVFWSRTGPKNLAEFSPFYRKYEIQWGIGKLTDSQWRDVQRVMGFAQFEAVKNFLHEVIRSAVKKDVKDYAEINLTAGVLDSRAKLLDDPDYAKRLDDAVLGAGGLKVRDIIPVPLTRVEDFLPDLIIMGPKGIYGGFANWKTPESERIVFLDMLGLALRYVSSWPLAEHEFVHTNPYLQGTPLTFYFDVEMWAALTTDLDDDFTEFLFHPYLSVVRDMARTFFGYDFEEVKRRVWPTGALGADDIREKEFRANAAEVKKIRVELLKFVKDPKDGLMAQFYRDPYFWIAVNTKYCDTSAAWRILFALRYEPAGLYDPEKKDKDGNAISPVLQTKSWLMKEEESGRIKDLADKAMKKTGEQTELGKKFVEAKVFDASGTAACPVDAKFFFMNEKEKQKFTDTILTLASRAKNGDFEAKVLLLRIFGTAGVLPSIPARIPNAR